MADSGSSPSASGRQRLRVFLADDHPILREGLKRLICAESDMEVVGEAGDGAGAIAGAAALKPDVLLMDISMPFAAAGGAAISGLEAARRLKSRMPSIRVLALSVHEDRSYLRQMLELGAAGYLLKRAPSEELIRAIRTVAEGGVHIDSRIAGKLVENPLGDPREEVSGVERLTPREAAVLRRIAEGYSHKEIAAQLELSVKTVETYKARAMEKLHLASRVDIVRLASGRGWLESV